MNRKLWRHIDEQNVSASYGLACDEFLMNAFAAEKYQASLRLYTYKNYSALCGRFQDLSAEIDLEACKTKGFQVGRRLTGGGAIIMGEDQLGICLSTHSSKFQWKHIRELYQLFSAPIINALATFGIKAGLRAKNDLEVNGKKIAGLGIHISQDGGIQFHASLLLDLDVPAMLSVLNIPIQKFEDKRMIQSVAQRMTTVRTESGSNISMEQLKQAVMESYAESFSSVFQKEPIQSNERAAIEHLEQDRYLNEEWLKQLSPQQDMTGMSLKKTPAGLLRTYIGLKGDTIKSVLITGDFLEMPELLAQLESRLKWTVLDKEKINTIIVEIATAYPSVMKAEDLAEAIWLAAQRAHASHRYTYHGSCYYPKEENVGTN